jgi:hypothetical protein
MFVYNVEFDAYSPVSKRIVASSVNQAITEAISVCIDRDGCYYDANDVKSVTRGEQIDGVA